MGDRVRRLGRRVALASLAAAALLVGAPTGATAATQLGETFPNPGFCTGGTTYIQTESAGPSYAVPSPGVITSWSFQADGNAPTQMKLKVARRAGGDDLTIVGESVQETIAPSSLNTFPTRVPVSTGDLIGFYLSDTGDCSRSDPTFTDLFFSGDVLTGDTEEFSDENFQLDISARFEPYRCSGRDATIAGTTGRDRLVGTPGNDVIAGLEGKDKIKGSGGKDRICGAKGKDQLKGGAGNDILKGAKGDDRLNGGGGKDECVGGPGDDKAKKCEVERST